MDPHVSWLGYYSRFNGGMLSVCSYVILYYAFVSNITNITPLLKVILSTATAVTLYGVAERMGIDKSIWVQDVQNRVFSTLGQPNWLAAYIVALLPISIAMTTTSHIRNIKYWIWSLISILFFTVLLFTRSRSGLLGFVVVDILFWLLVYIQQKRLSYTFFLLHSIFALIVFFNGSNVAQIDKYFTFSGIKNNILHAKQSPTPPVKTPGYSAPALEVGGTESGTIRKYVWQGAITAWRSSTKIFLIGTGTETFAFAFYQFRPAQHNLTSEWDFLYNKAHNEYLNYLATTGLFGLGSYLLLLGTFMFWFIKSQISKLKTQNKTNEFRILEVALFAGWLSILFTNFFGFSVVIMQIFLFLFPAIIITLAHTADKNQKNLIYTIPASWSFSLMITSVFVTMVILLGSVMTNWYADTLFATSYRQARTGQYAQAKIQIEQAISLNPFEPLYRDEVATTLAAIAGGAFEQQNATAAAQFAKRALEESDKAITTSPQNVNFWKTRTKIYYTFSAYDPSFNSAAIGALEKAGSLSPNDPKIYYNLAILYGRAANNDKAIELLKKSIELKPNYHDAYYALYVFYLEIKKPEVARAVLTEYLEKIDSTDKNFAEILGKTKQ